MIIIFTSVENGGIAQFTVKIFEVIHELGYEVRCFLPNSKHVFIPDELKDYCVFYDKFKVINMYNSKLASLKKQILKYDPEIIWYCDNGIISNQVCMNIKNVKQLLTIHDINFHPSYSRSIKNTLKEIYQKYVTSCAIKKANRVIMLSKYSKQLFDDRYSKYAMKDVLLNLGAHIPNCKMHPLKEINGIKDYYMFFGRIDRYKGVGTLIKAYNDYNSQSHKLVIAGAGQLTLEEKDLIDKNSNIILINRFIEDEEMLYLFNNARVLFLPYIEASQSGVIPISYHYGIPVVVSNVKGLTQVVENNKTGVICSSQRDFTDAMILFDDEQILNNYKSNSIMYSSTYLDWNKNIKSIFDSI